MRPDYTHITVILDRTGSMEPIRDDIIGGFNAFLAEQQALPGRATLTLVQFDSRNPYEVLHHFAPIQQVPRLTRESYVPRASTPLLDAMGRGIDDLEQSLLGLPAEERPGQVVMLIITDGQENASREFTKARVTQMIAEKQQQGWQFVFLSADLDAIKDALAAGVRSAQVMAFDRDAQGTRAAMVSTAQRLAEYRMQRAKEMRFTDEDRRKQRSEQRRTLGANRMPQGTVGTGLDDPRLTNRQRLELLLAQGRIRLQRSPIFDQPPPLLPLPPEQVWARVEGMILGLAIADSLGNTSEALRPSQRRARHGEIRDYLPNRHAEGRAVGLPSDDTQLAAWLLEHLLEAGTLDPDRLAQKFVSRTIFGIGKSMRQFIRHYKDEHLPWYAAGVASAGNGALMRIAPVLIPYLRQPSADLYVDTALAAMLTHNDSASTSACVAWVAMLWELLGMAHTPDPEWWVRRYVVLARPVEGEQTQYAPRDCPGSPYQGYRGPLWRFVETHVLDAWRKRAPVKAACSSWCSGAYLLETLPSVLYILMHYAHDPEEAIVRAVNDTYDNDTIAAIVGTAVGALHGVDALPERWRQGLLGRTGHDDDGPALRPVAPGARPLGAARALIQKMNLRRITV